MIWEENELFVNYYIWLESELWLCRYLLHLFVSVRDWFFWPCDLILFSLSGGDPVYPISKKKSNFRNTSLEWRIWKSKRRLCVTAILWRYHHGEWASVSFSALLAEGETECCILDIEGCGSVSCLVVSNSLWLHESVHRILQVRILEWVVISFSRGSFLPRNRTWVFCIAGRFFTIWATREAQEDVETFSKCKLKSLTAICEPSEGDLYF